MDVLVRGMPMTSLNAGSNITHSAIAFQDSSRVTTTFNAHCTVHSFRSQRSARFSYKPRHLFLLQLVTLSCTDWVFFIQCGLLSPRGIESSGVLTTSRSVAEGYTPEHQWSSTFSTSEVKVSNQFTCSTFSVVLSLTHLRKNLV